MGVSGTSLKASIVIASCDPTLSSERDRIDGSRNV